MWTDALWNVSLLRYAGCVPSTAFLSSSLINVYLSLTTAAKAQEERKVTSWGWCYLSWQEIIGGASGLPQPCQKTFSDLLSKNSLWHWQLWRLQHSLSKTHLALRGASFPALSQISPKRIYFYFCDAALFTLWDWQIFSYLPESLRSLR